MDTVKDRTLQFVKYKGITMRAFEAMCGLSTGYVTSMRKGFGTAKLNNVLTAFPDLSRDWLLFGEGSMLKSQQPQHSQVVSGENNNAVQMNGTGNTYNAAPLPIVASESLRPIVPTELYKKPNTDIYDEIVVKRAGNVEYAQFFATFSDYDMYMRVQDDSMLPNFVRGDLLALSAMAATYILNGTIYVLDTKSYGIVLRVVIDRGDAYECHVIGDESRYAPFSVPKSDVIRIYQVMGLIRTCVS